MKSRPAKILELKGATLTVLTVNTCTDDLQQLAGALMELTGGAPDFFDYDAAVLDFSSLETPGEQAPNWLIARGVFARHRLNLFAVRAAPTAWQESATAAGLSWIVEAEVLRPARPSTQKTVKPDATKETEAITASPGHAEGAQNADATKRQLDLNFQAKADQEKNSESAGAAGPVRPAVKEKTLAQVNVVAGRAEEAPVTLSRPTTLVIDKPLRSGQRVYARDADLVVMAAVNAGAEVIADGNIHVYAPLRGRALAGAHGDESARILTTCFEAELVSIAGVYSTFEPGFPVGVFGGAAQVQLKVAGETESGEGEKTTLRVVPLKH